MRFKVIISKDPYDSEPYVAVDITPVMRIIMEIRELANVVNAHNDRHDLSAQTFAYLVERIEKYLYETIKFE